MKRIVLSAVLLAAATYGFAATASTPTATAPHVDRSRPGLFHLDQVPGTTRTETYTRIASDDDDMGSCWQKAVGYVTCNVVPRNQCYSSTFITKSFMYGGNCDPNENPF